MMTEEQIVARLLAGRLDKPRQSPPKLAAALAAERWNKPRPIVAVIADTLTHTQALLTRFEAGVYAPTDKRRADYEWAIRDLYLQTQKQLAALSLLGAEGP
jgi:hypothetical protein